MSELPKIRARPRLERCESCGEFVFPDDRHCPICAVDRIAMKILKAADKQTLQAIAAHFDAAHQEQ